MLLFLGGFLFFFYILFFYLSAFLLSRPKPNATNKNPGRKCNKDFSPLADGSPNTSPAWSGPPTPPPFPPSPSPFPEGTGVKVAVGVTVGEAFAFGDGFGVGVGHFLSLQSTPPTFLLNSFFISTFVPASPVVIFDPPTLSFAQFPPVSAPASTSLLIFAELF